MSETILNPPPTARICLNYMSRACLNVRVSLAEAVTSWFTQLLSVTNAMETLNPNTLKQGKLDKQAFGES